MCKREMKYDQRKNKMRVEFQMPRLPTGELRANGQLLNQWISMSTLTISGGIISERPTVAWIMLRAGSSRGGAEGFATRVPGRGIRTSIECGRRNTRMATWSLSPLV